MPWAQNPWDPLVSPPRRCSADPHHHPGPQILTELVSGGAEGLRFLCMVSHWDLGEVRGGWGTQVHAAGAHWGPLIPAASDMGWGHSTQPHAHQFLPNIISSQMRAFMSAPFARFECCTVPDPPHSSGGKLRQGLCPPWPLLLCPMPEWCSQLLIPIQCN